MGSYASEHGQMASCSEHGNKQKVREIFLLAQE